jgi:hypothetical protein
MKMCPWNKEGLLQHRLAMWAAIKLPFSRKFLIWLDDAMGYGKRNPIKKWWLDLVKEGQRVVKAEGVNARDLTLERKPKSDNSGVAVYAVETLPTADQKQPVPVDRKQGLAETVVAEAKLRELKKERPAAR